MNKHFKKYLDYIIKMDQVVESKKLLSIKEQADNEFGKFVIDMKHNEFINNLIENKNSFTFGEIKHMFENISDKLFNSKQGLKTIKKYTDTIKENKSLWNLHLLQENIFNPVNVNSSLINEGIEIIGNINKKELEESKAKLFNILIEGISQLTDIYAYEVDDNVKQLSEDIEYLVTNKKSLLNINEYTNKLDNLISHVETGQSEDTIVSESVMDMIDEFNEKYTINLSPDEKNAVKEMLVFENKKLFENHKGECLTLIEGVLMGESDDNNLKNRLIEIKDKLETKEFNNETVDSDIVKFIELKNTLKNS